MLHLPPPGREFFLGDDGTVLHASWHLDRGLVNLSVWRDDRCTDTFQLALADAARLVGFLAEGLAAAATDRAGASPPTTTRTDLGAAVRRLAARCDAPEERTPSDGARGRARSHAFHRQRRPAETCRTYVASP